MLSLPKLSNTALLQQLNLQDCDLRYLVIQQRKPAQLQAQLARLRPESPVVKHTFLLLHGHSERVLFSYLRRTTDSACLRGSNLQQRFLCSIPSSSASSTSFHLP